MLRISLRDKIRNENFWKTTGVTDIVETEAAVGWPSWKTGDREMDTQNCNLQIKNDKEKVRNFAKTVARWRGKDICKELGIIIQRSKWMEEKRRILHPGENENG